MAGTGVVIGVLAVAGLVAGQAAWIARLLVDRHRRQQAARRSRRQWDVLAQRNDDAAWGTWSASLAHELNQPLGAILAHAETVDLLLAHDGPLPHEALRELLAAIREDQQRAATVLARLQAAAAAAPPSPT